MICEVAFNNYADHLGTPRAITRPSDNAVVWRWDNTEPFGNNAANENPSGLGSFKYNKRFPGQYYDEETGTSQNWHRDYDAAIGRYRQSDPIGLADGSNTFAYVKGQPLASIDPKGLFTSSVHNEITRDALRRAQVSCPKLPEDVAMVDWIQFSQDPKNSHWHAMSDGTNPGQSRGDAKKLFEQHVNQQWKSCACSGLAMALHALQDSFAKGHKDHQPWSGGMPSASHVYHDGYPSKEERRRATDASADLLRKFKQGCDSQCPMP